MMADESGAVGGMSRKGNRITREKLAPKPLLHHNSHIT
jgi:hypothetical protein